MLRFGLPDVLRARAGLEQAQLGVGGLALCGGAPEGQGDVGRVELGDCVAGLHAVALVGSQLEQAPADFRRYADLRGLDVTRDPDVVGRGLVAAGE